jgi:hypothetical protein
MEIDLRTYVVTRILQAIVTADWKFPVDGDSTIPSNDQWDKSAVDRAIKLGKHLLTSLEDSK